MSTRKKSQLSVAGQTVEVSNLEKVLYPDAGFTKGDVIDYCIQVSPALLPHLKDRPLTLKRYPEGVKGFFFYEKQCPSHRPGWIRTAQVPRRHGGSVEYCVVNGLPALVWAANLADLELHTFLHRAPKLAEPTFMVFDLDPGPPADIISCCGVALSLKKLLDSFHLKSFPKTSGSKGLQVCAPLNSGASYERVKAFARATAERLAAETSDKVVSRMEKALRRGKVLVDWSQNDTHKTTICAYSLRAKDRPTVSTPVTWEEIASAFKGKNSRRLSFEPKAVLKRVEKQGDLFSSVLKLKQKLPEGEVLQE